MKMRKRMFLYVLCSLLTVFQPAYCVNPVKIDMVKNVPEYQLQAGKAVSISLTCNDGCHDAFYIVSKNDLGEYERGSSVEFGYHTVARFHS